MKNEYVNLIINKINNMEGNISIYDLLMKLNDNLRDDQIFDIFTSIYLYYKDNKNIKLIKYKNNNDITKTIFKIKRNK